MHRQRWEQDLHYVRCSTAFLDCSLADGNKTKEGFLYWLYSGVLEVDGINKGVNLILVSCTLLFIFLAMNSSLNLVCIFPSSTNSTPLCMFRLSFLFYELLTYFLLFYGWFLLFWLAVSGQNGKVHFYLWFIFLCSVIFWKWMGL